MALIVESVIYDHGDYDCSDYIKCLVDFYFCLKKDNRSISLFRQRRLSSVDFDIQKDLHDQVNSEVSRGKILLCSQHFYQLRLTLISI